MTLLGVEYTFVSHWKDFLSGATHHREFAVTEPHHPAGPICSSTPAAHPPRHNPAGPPRETTQLPEHQRADAETSAILSAQKQTL